LEMMMRSSSRRNVRRHDGVCVNSNAREREKEEEKLAVRGLKTTTTTNHTKEGKLLRHAHAGKREKRALSLPSHSNFLRRRGA
jgi:hypothetical protein